jgi:uncharacterized protein YcsI (UPF0317 family)
MTQAPGAIGHRDELRDAVPHAVRGAIRDGRWEGPTVGMARGFIQANMAIVPERYAFDFLRFCLRNPKPCPLVEVLDPGDPVPHQSAPDGDVRTDLSRYRVFRDGRLVEEVPHLRMLWRKDHVAFLMGCSLSFDQAMLDGGIDLRHLQSGQGRIAVYESGIACRPAGMFHGPMIVSMRPIPRRLLVRAIEITSQYPIAHGAPVHVGDGADIGIADMADIHSGKFNPVGADEVPVFWGCGVTPQAIAAASGVPEMITHATGHLFVTDLRISAHRTGLG